jgi:glycosyltransferase involved in cell wall biosynthesis
MISGSSSVDARRLSVPTYKVDVALIAQHLGGGGAERVLLNLAIAFHAQGLKVDLVLVNATGAFLRQVPTGVGVVDLASTSALRSIPSLARYLRRVRPRALLSALGHVNVAAILARRLSGVRCKLVVSIHNSISEAIRAQSPKTRILAYTERLLYPLADACIAVSEGVKRDFVRATGIRDETIKVIYNPVIGPELQKAAMEKVDHDWLRTPIMPTLIAVGRLSPQKDYPSVFQALSLVRRSIPARLIVLGEGEERGALEALRKILDLEDQIDMPGFVANPYAFVARANLLVLPSRYEGLPTVLIEALGVGTPVISTDCPSGPAEILANGRYGTLVPTGDPVALAHAIVRVLSTLPLASVSNEAVAPYRFDTVIPQYVAVLGL